MRLFLFILAFFICLGVGSLVGMFFPYQFYQATLEQGADNQYLKIPKSLESFHKGEVYQREKAVGVYSQDETLWHPFHFSHFELPLPLRHPYYLVIPSLTYREGEQDLAGMRFLGPRQKELGSFTVGEKFKFQRSFNKQKLFLLPLFKNFILKKSQHEIWVDVFSRDITLPARKSLGLVDYLKDKIWPIEYKELVYNLFILQMRNTFLPKNSKKVFFLEGLNIGMVEVKEKEIEKAGEDQYKREVYFLIEKGFVYSFEMITDRNRLEAEALRRIFVENIKYKESFLESAIPISAKYRQLDYKNQVDQEGMTYLLVSFTHIIHDDERAKNYLKRMIQFLERGEKNLQHISPLYSYSFKRFGTTFSKFKESLKERPGRRVERAMDEAFDKELKDASKKEAYTEGKFENKEAKIKFFLNEAKRSGKNSDDDESKLIVD